MSERETVLHASYYDTVLTSTRGKRQGENLRVKDRNTVTGSAERVRFAEGYSCQLSQ